MNKALNSTSPVRFNHRVILKHSAYLTIGCLCVANLFAHLLKKEINLNCIDLPRPRLQRLAHY